MKNGDVRKYDYKTIIVSGGIHEALRKYSRIAGLSINKYIYELMKQQDPNVQADIMPAECIGKKEV